MLFRDADEIRDALIACVVFGDTRNSRIRKKFGATAADVNLQDGDILTMEGRCRDIHLHRLSPGGSGSASIQFNLIVKKRSRGIEADA